MYDLFILGQLMDLPMSGYALRRAMSFAIGEPFMMSWGSLYPLLTKLAEAGEIELTVDANDSKRHKKIAAITDSGRAHFRKLVNAPVKPNKQMELTFQIKFNFLHLLTLAEADQILSEYQTHCETALAQIETHRQHVLTKSTMAPADVQDFKHLYQLQKNRLQAQLDWAIERQQKLPSEEQL